MSNWYEEARKEFLLDLALFNGVDQNISDKIYMYLSDIGLVDYDIEKEYLLEQYTDE